MDETRSYSGLQAGGVGMQNLGSQNVAGSGYGIQDASDDILRHRRQDIGDILQQIMTITDQSLDEAQARLIN